MGPETTMTSQQPSTNPDSTILAVPKLRDDGSNWSDYYPRIQNAMGAKGLWRHVLGTATAPVPYVVTQGIPMLHDGKTPATEDQIEAKESKIIEFEKREYLAKHILLSTTSTRLGSKIKDLPTAESMWKVVKEDVTSKSTLYILDAEDQLSSMKLPENEDPKTHLSELKHHFQLMQSRRDNLIKIGSTLSESRFNIIIMSSLPDSYRPTLQTITASERVNKLSGGQTSSIKSDDLIAFIIEEAQHRVINEERTKTAESALAARSSTSEKSKGKGKRKEKSKIKCENCKIRGHTKEQCYAKGGGCEGQGPKQKAKAKAAETAVVAVNDEEGELFAFTCSSDNTAVAAKLVVPNSRLGTCIDSGASRDYCPDRSKFTNYKSIQKNITTADGRTLSAIGMGDLHVELPNGSNKTKVVFKNAIHAPGMAFTLISISRLDQAGYSVTFNKSLCSIKNPSGKTIATIPHSDGLYKIAASKASDVAGSANVAAGKMTISEAHRKLGHIAHSAIKHAITNGFILGVELDPNSKVEFCEACAKAKSARQPFPKESETRAEKFGDRVHWDLWGPASVKSINGNHYVAARIDDATRQTKLYFQKKKSEAYYSYLKDEAYIENQYGNQIKSSRSDRGGEFLSEKLIKHQDFKGTKRELTVHDSPPQNGVSERGMRTRAERARALLISSGLPRFLWEEAMRHSAWLQDRTPARALNGKTPYEMGHNKKPNLAGIQEFGTAAYVKDLTAGKLDARAQKGRFVGYDSESKGYRIYWPSKKSVSVERNVVFNPDDANSTDDVAIIYGEAQSEGEKQKVIQASPNGTDDVKEPENETTQAESTNEEDPITHPESEPSSTTPNHDVEPPDEPSDAESSTPPEYGRGKRARHAKGTYKNLNEGLTAAVSSLNEDETPHEVDDSVDSPYHLPPDFSLAGYAFSDPTTLDEALRGPNVDEWLKALDYEINQLERLGTWVVEDLPPGQSAIPCSGVTRVKRGPNGEVQSYRVRIVAGGHRQVEGVNYTETFSAAAKMPTVRTVLANAAHNDWEIEHVDVKSAYLNAPLKETIYMKAPRGVLKPGQEGKVLRLLKGLYGLKQAGRGWYQEMSKVFMHKMGFKRSAIDHSVFYRRSKLEHTIVAVATDDMAVTSKRAVDAKNFKSEIKKHWEITDHGPIGWFLGFEIKRDRKAKTLSINQRAYIESMVEKFRLTNTKRVHTPMDPNVHYSTQQSPSSISQVGRMKGIPYAEAIGSILWPTVVSRPDTAFAVGILSQFMQNPGQAHWEAVKRVVSYLDTTKDMWLTFGGNKNGLLEGYCDADWASQPHRHSISGYSFHFGVGAISWSSKKQSIVTLSSTEAEYVAETHAAKEGIWLRSFIKEIMGIERDPLTLKADNQGAIALAKDNKFHARTKHIDLRYHFIREAVDDGKIKMEYIPTIENVADIFTKPLVRSRHEELVAKLGLGRCEEKGVGEQTKG
jgi:Reverse transcriptase (RNA-dependent DNA polymerase)/gag-polypeptide of LTR copia-type/GAG-pre-integrase domain